jgi:predicted metal-dependent hydrolase
MSDPDSWLEALRQGRSAFNRGEFFDAHERWEEAWHQLVGPPRVMVQGLIQIAAGLHHLQQGRPRPGVRLLAKGLEKLRGGSPMLLADLRVDSLSGAVARLLAELESFPGRVPDTRLLEL